MPKAKVVALRDDQTSNAGASTYDASVPYIARVTIKGVCPLLFHRWNDDAVAAKAASAKGSAAKKSDDTESYVYRDERGHLALPGEYLRQSIIHAAKFRQDPRSPRKSAMDLFKAAVIPVTIMASLGVKEPDFLDRRRVMVQRSAITRTRPAMNTGWQATIDLMVNLPEYVSETLLREVLNDAGRLIGIADFRPTFGRFSVTRFEVLGS
jgi:hypothetical protein